MPICPICTSSAFKDYNGRADAVCQSCDSLERTRYLWLYLHHLKAVTPGSRVLHVAPEKCLTKRLREAIGSFYQPVDFEPQRYSTDEVAVEHFDMCADIFQLKEESLDVIMHLHVLEHIPCALDGVLVATLKALKRGGRLIFAVPINDGITIENWWPDVTREERIEVFGQFDHLRRIGAMDFPRLLARVLQPFSSQSDFRVDPAAIGEDVLSRAAVPVDRARSLTGDTLFDVVRTA